MFESFGYLDEVNSADTNRLPFHLKAKWLEVAVSIQESGQCPSIHNILQFISERARAASNNCKEKSKKISPLL